MSAEKRRAARNKAYALGYDAGLAGVSLVNPYKVGSESKADVTYSLGYEDGVGGERRYFESPGDCLRAAIPKAVAAALGSAAGESEETRG